MANTPTRRVIAVEEHFVTDHYWSETDAVMFSIDYPYESSVEAVAEFEQTTLSDNDREKIAHGNAERILRLR
jgi:predicted TIM-barrel fold metal-dependent hydrolase